jgi:hypothetical protein
MGEASMRREVKNLQARLRRRAARPANPELLAACRDVAERSLAAFLWQAWPVVEPSTPLVWGRHLDALCLHLKTVTRGDLRNLVITIPPGSTKSITCAVMWPAWVWAPQPGARWLTGSNGADLVLRDAVACRRLIEWDWYRLRWGPVFRLTSDQDVQSWHENRRRGFRAAVTVKSAVTGRNGDVLLLDDPDDARRVRSEAERRAVHDGWDGAFFNRVNDHRAGQRVAIGQRPHEQDLIGHVLAGGGFEPVNLPEELDPDPRGLEGEVRIDHAKEDLRHAAPPCAAQSGAAPSHLCLTDPDLATIVDACPALAEDVRHSILNLVREARAREH